MFFLNEKDPLNNPSLLRKILRFFYNPWLNFCRRPIAFCGRRIVKDVIPEYVRRAQARRSLRQRSDRRVDESVIHVALSIDRNFVRPASVALKSLIVNHIGSEQLSIYILEDGLNEADKALLMSVANSGDVSISFISICQGEPLNFLVNEYISYASYVKLLIGRYLPIDVNRLIMIDADTLVTADIDALWHHDLQDNIIGAVAEQNAESLYVSSQKGLRNYQELGLRADQRYFNAGLLLIDLSRWRNENIEQRLIDYYQQHHDQIIFHDQDVLNAVLANEWHALDIRWNVTSAMFYRKTYLDNKFCTQEEYLRIVYDPYILHFTTQFKPWRILCSHPYQKLWRYYDKGD